MWEARVAPEGVPWPERMLTTPGGKPMSWTAWARRAGVRGAREVLVRFFKTVQVAISGGIELTAMFELTFLRRLQNDRTAGRESWANLHRKRDRRNVPGDDGCDRANWLAEGHVDKAWGVQARRSPRLISSLCVVLEQAGGKVSIKVCRDLTRLLATVRPS